jgi:predicted PurR-regulated permease PerM
MEPLMTQTTGRSDAPGNRTLVRSTLVVGGLVVLALLAWQLHHVLLLGFAAILLAVILRAAAEGVERITPIPAPWSLGVAALAILVLLAGFVALLGAQVQAEIGELADELPGLLDEAGERLGVDDLQDKVVGWAESLMGGGFMQAAADYAAAAFNAATTGLVVIAAAAYLAINPKRYRDGALKLVPPSVRGEIGETADNAGRALRSWLLGQLISMVIVGALTTLGLMLIGVPSPLALGVLAGLLEFIPMVGPIIAAVPAVLLGLSEGGTTALWVVLLYVVIQQVEGNLIMPLIQKRAVNLPPVVMLFAILVAGVLFGALGVVLAVPLAVVVYVAVKRLYVRDALGDDVEIPGETAKE